MEQDRVVGVEDITNVAFTQIRPGCEKRVLQQGPSSQAGVFRVQPGGGVPTHRHSRVHDLFVGIRGEIEIRYDGPCGKGMFLLKPGAFCSIPPGVRHEVSNPSATHEACFVLVHAPYEGFDIQRA